jgi:hypothetical protein
MVLRQSVLANALANLQLSQIKSAAAGGATSADRLSSSAFVRRRLRELEHLG